MLCRSSRTPNSRATLQPTPNLKIGILGYGRFGTALAVLIAERGYSLRGCDPESRVPDEHAVASVDALLAQFDLIIVAVPVDAFEAVLRDLRPRLGSQHQVMDVCQRQARPVPADGGSAGRRHWPRRLPPAVRSAQHRPGGTL